MSACSNARSCTGGEVGCLGCCFRKLEAAKEFDIKIEIRMRTRIELVKAGVRAERDDQGGKNSSFEWHKR